MTYTVENPMSLDQFYEELRAVTASGVKWSLNRDGREGMIRAIGQSIESCPCPWVVVRNRIGIENDGYPLPLILAIAHAADNDPNHDPAIRSALLEACGLKEAA